MQHDNRLTQEIGNLTTQVALQTQRDSASMITLAVVTTLFLPGAFISVSSPPPRLVALVDVL